MSRAANANVHVQHLMFSLVIPPAVYAVESSNLSSVMSADAPDQLAANPAHSSADLVFPRRAPR